MNVADELEDAVAKALAHSKFPEEFVLDRVIPKSPAGKILKRVRRD